MLARKAKCCRKKLNVADNVNEKADGMGMQGNETK